MINSRVANSAATLFIGAAVATVYAQDKTPPAPPAAGPGLVNTWLRQQSEAFKPWDLGGQVRVRYEIFDKGPSFDFPTRDFQSHGADNENAYLLVREKVHLGYAPTAWGSAFVEARDSSSTGDSNAKNPGADQLDLHQGYISLGQPGACPASLKVGRQEFIYGDERLVGNSDWGNTARVFDAAKARLSFKDTWVDFFSSRVILVDNHNFNMPNDYDWFSGVYASTRALVPFQQTEAYVLARDTAAGSLKANAGGSPDSAGAGPRDILSVGVRFQSLPGKLGAWDYTVEAVGQLGSVNNGAKRVDQEAQALAASGGYTWKEAFGSPRVGIEYDFSSGDSDPKDGVSHTLDNLFPTNHKHYGTMDLVGWRNMHDLRGSFSLKPAKGLSVTVDYHSFWLADTRDYFYPQSGGGRSGLGYGLNPGYSNYLGSELGLEASYSVTKWSTVRLGCGHFFAGDYVKQSKASVGGAVDANWFYSQIVVNF